MRKRSFKYVKDMVKAMFTDLPEVATIRELEQAFHDNNNDPGPGAVRKACEELVKEGVLRQVGRAPGRAWEATDEFIEEEGIEVDR